MNLFSFWIFHSLFFSSIFSFKSTEINRDIKLHVFLCLGDIALGCKNSIIPYLDEIKKMFDIAFIGAVEISVIPLIFPVLNSL